MRKFFYRHRSFWMFILFFMISVGNAYCIEKKNEEIVINQKSKSLISPEGESYIWFFNGEAISYTREIEAKKSGTYSVKICDEQNNIVEKSVSVIVDVNGIRKIHIIGDSTVADYGSDKYPQTGWGQVLQLYFDNSKILVDNHAIGGRSSRSFYQEGRWTEVKNQIDSNDFVFIQFGHNDRDWTKEERYTDTTDYKEYLRIYVNDTRNKGAIPVLISPMVMNAYAGARLRNVFTENENDYRGAMFHVAQELDVLFIDLNMRSHARISEVGKEYATKYLFFGLEPGEYPNFPEGMGDGTHFQEMGALEMCNLLKEGIEDWEESESKAALVDALKPTYKLTVNFDNIESAIATLSGYYPVNTHITLKTRVGKGNTFKQWNDENDQLLTETNLYQFTMEAKDYTFTPIVSDCYGTEGGTASIDNCGICSGGTTDIEACVGIFQSESGCSYEGNYESITFGDITRGVINTTSYPNSAILYGIKTQTAGKYDFGLIYSGTDTTETLDVFVNDEPVIEELKLQNDSNWNVAQISLDLAEGVNFVKIVSSSLTGGTMFDMLAAYSTGLTRSCTPPTIIPSDIQAGSIYPNPFSNTLQINLGSPFNYNIFDLSGKMLLSGNCSSTCTVGEKLENGIYFLRILQDNKSSIRLIEKM